jgi:hypothetical protein
MKTWAGRGEVVVKPHSVHAVEGRAADGPVLLPPPPSLQTFISKEHEKATYGEMSPGPTTGHRISAIGKQTQSNRSTSPGWGFGTSKVRHTAQHAAPCIASTRHTALCSYSVASCCGLL